MLTAMLCVLVAMAQGTPVEDHATNASDAKPHRANVVVIDETGLPSAQSRVWIVQRIAMGTRVVARPDVAGGTVIAAPLDQGSYKVIVRTGEREETGEVEVPRNMTLGSLELRLGKEHGLEIGKTLETICIARPANQWVNWFPAPPN